MSARVGVVLSGCGYLDGTEITEAVSVLVALDRRGATAMCMAPSGPQAGVVDHLTQKPKKGQRNVLHESARIARGKVVDIAGVKADDLDILVFPGGFGGAKNLSTFAAQGKEMTVNPDVERLIRDMHAARKPVGFACVSPVIGAKVLGAAGVKPRLTVGTDPGTASAIDAMGGHHQETTPTGVCIDEDNRLVSTPCYMNDVGPWVVFQGAERMVDQLLMMSGDPDSQHRHQMAHRQQAVNGGGREVHGSRSKVYVA